MKITLVSASHRLNSQSSKIGHYLAKQLQGSGVTTHLIDLGKSPLPFWDEGVWDKTERWQQILGPIQQELQSSDGFIFLVPEWAGMSPAAMHNFLHVVGNQVLAHKPCMLVGVSSSTGGAYPISELRANSSKNTRVLYIPDHLIVRNCEKVLNEPEPVSDEDRYIRTRITYHLKVLKEYCRALKALREGSAIDLKAYPNGM